MPTSPAELPISVHASVASVYHDAAQSLQAGPRWNNLIDQFYQRFRKYPTHVARAPGRVNIIGEHIDYCLFGVLPAAVDRDILIACAPTDGMESSTISAENLDGSYKSASFEAMKDSKGEWELPIDTAKLQWESYIKAAYHGVLSHFFSDSGGESPRGAQFLVTGTVPLGGGLSSSAAMVVASTLAFLAVNDKLQSLTQGQLVELAMENEKRVGVNSGGMDQGASVLSSPASALYITFYPKLHASPVPLPQTTPATVYVIANTLKTANKAETSKIHYNLRVVETLVAARILALGLNVQVGAKERVRLREVLARWLGEKDEGAEATQIAQLKEGLERILPKVDRILGTVEGQRGLTYEEMVNATGMTEVDFREVYLSWVEVEATHFQLYKRAKHVYSEALRVLQFREFSIKGVHDSVNAIPHPTTSQALGRQRPQPDPKSTASASAQHNLGRLMNESHESCDQLFDCSCPELNQLTALARESGAIGSRLTGAGWGGCCVSLVHEDEVPTFIEKLTKAYPPYQNMSKEELGQVVFATKPGSGAGVYTVSSGLTTIS